MPERHYTGSCQCGAVRFEADVDVDQTITCNCSRCGRLGAILAFAPPEKFRLVSGEDAVTEYKFNRHIISHFFCKTCGIQGYSRGKMPDGSPMGAVNVRCLDGVDPFSLKPGFFDGASA